MNLGESRTGYFRKRLNSRENLVNGKFDVHSQLFAIVVALLSWRYGQGLEIRWTLNWQYVAILSQTILRISESILGLDFNRMSDDRMSDELL